MIVGGSLARSSGLYRWKSCEILARQREWRDDLAGGRKHRSG